MRTPQVLERNSGFYVPIELSTMDPSAVATGSLTLETQDDKVPSSNHSEHNSDRPQYDKTLADESVQHRFYNLRQSDPGVQITELLISENFVTERTLAPAAFLPLTPDGPIIIKDNVMFLLNDKSIYALELSSDGRQWYRRSKLGGFSSSRCFLGLASSPTEIYAWHTGGEIYTIGFRRGEITEKLLLRIREPFRGFNFVTDSPPEAPLFAVSFSAGELSFLRSDGTIVSTIEGLDSRVRAVSTTLIVTGGDNKTIYVHDMERIRRTQRLPKTGGPSVAICGDLVYTPDVKHRHETSEDAKVLDSVRTISERSESLGIVHFVRGGESGRKSSSIMSKFLRKIRKLRPKFPA